MAWECSMGTWHNSLQALAGACAHHNGLYHQHELHVAMGCACVCSRQHETVSRQVKADLQCVCQLLTVAGKLSVLLTVHGWSAQVCCDESMLRAEQQSVCLCERDCTLVIQLGTTCVDQSVLSAPLPGSSQSLLLRWLHWWRLALSAEHNICRLPPAVQLFGTQSLGAGGIILSPRLEIPHCTWHKA